jgi:guanine deaminase
VNEKFMLEAIRLAGEMMQKGCGGPFGAVVVRDDHIVASGYNMVTSTNEPTAHAEIVAIRKSCKAIDNFSLAGCQIYSNCEPCPMCLAAIYWAGIDTVYYAASKEDAAAVNFADGFIYKEFAKPIDKRQIKMVQIMRDQALPVFEAWVNLENKIEY